MLGQHHGLPTRLLDWSKSPLMALHFAVTESNMDNMDRRDCAVYKLDIEVLNKSLPQKYQDEIEASGQKVFTIEMLDHVCRDLDQYDADMEKKNTMVIVEPPSMDERMMNQYSFFSIMPSHVSKAEDVLNSLKDAVTKYVIDKNLRWEIRDMLDMSNINERVVYPGLDGIATWLARHYYVRDTGRLYIEKKDIVNLNVDVIVNSADKSLKCSGKIAESIFNKAGYEKVSKECAEKGACEIGKVVETKGYDLKAKYILHAVTPRKQDNNEDEAEQLLRSTYKESLEWVKENKYHSVGFPLMGGGYKGFSKEEAWRIGLEESKEFIKRNEGYPLDIVFCVIDEASYVFGQNMLNALNYAEEGKIHYREFKGREYRKRQDDTDYRRQ